MVTAVDAAPLEELDEDEEEELDEDEEDEPDEDEEEVLVPEVGVVVAAGAGDELSLLPPPPELQAVASRVLSRQAGTKPQRCFLRP